MLPDGGRVPADRKCWPTQIPIPMAEEEEAEEEAADREEDEDLAAEFTDKFLQPDGGSIEVGQTVHMGWKVSYRKSEPELRCFSSWRKRYSAARQKWEASGAKLLSPQIKRTIEAQLLVQEAWRKKRHFRRPKSAAASSGDAV